MEFPGVSKKNMRNFHGLIKNGVEYPRVNKKKNVEFPGVFGLGVSKGSNTIFWNIKGLSLQG